MYIITVQQREVSGASQQGSVRPGQLELDELGVHHLPHHLLHEPAQPNRGQGLLVGSPS